MTLVTSNCNEETRISSFSYFSEINRQPDSDGGDIVTETIVERHMDLSKEAHLRSGGDAASSAAAAVVRNPRVELETPKDGEEGQRLAIGLLVID